MNPQSPQTPSFPGLDEHDVTWQRFKNRLQTITLPANEIVFQPGNACQHFLMVLEGSVKVTLSTAGGREIVLYRVERGGTCILTTACLFSNGRYPAEGRTETAVSALVMTPTDFQQALSESDAFRRFVFASLGQRFSDMMQRIEAVSFQPIDHRLAASLLQLMDQNHSIHLTHQSLAVELGSAREVISRHLKRFENQGWISQSRGNIDILDIAALKHLTQE